MSIFRRRSSAATLDEAPPSAAVPIPCNARGCERDTALPCSYRDRRGHACDSAFCEEHATLVGGLPYCRRHGSTIKALGRSANDPMTHPDVGNRAPSLVNWVAGDLDSPVRDILANLAHSGERVLSDQEVTLVHDQSRRPRWERSWRLVDHTGVIVKITCVVTDDDDAVVRVRVGSDEVVRAVPPWIERRRRGLQTTEEVDSSQRRIFYRFIEENIAATAERKRRANDQPVWTR
jgi:hypothetical protein